MGCGRHSAFSRTADGLQDVMAGGSATDTVISAGGGQNLRGQASGI